MPDDEHAAAISHVAGILHAVPHERWGVINIVPFTHDTPAVDALKQDVATGIVKSLAAQGHISQPQPAEMNRHIRVLCKSCNGLLFSGMTDADGGIGIAGPSFVQAMAQRRVECPHTPITAEDIRRSITDVVEGEQ